MQPNPMKRIQTFFISCVLIVFGLVILWGAIGEVLVNLARGTQSVFSLMMFLLGMILVIFGILGLMILSLKRGEVDYGQMY